MAVKTFEFGEEVRVGMVGVYYAHGIAGVEGGDEFIAGVADGAHMARGDVARRADKGKVLGVKIHTGSRFRR